MENCVFCKIIEGKLPANKVYEDKDFLAFLSIRPVNDGHTLVIPKKHVVWMQDTDDDTVGEIFKVAKKVMNGIKKWSNADYVHVSVAGEEVPHFHVHVFPRFLKQQMPSYPNKNLEKGEAIAEAISQAL